MEIIPAKVRPMFLPPSKYPRFFAVCFALACLPSSFAVAQKPVPPESRVNMFGAFLDADAQQRVVVREVTAGSPADAAGLKEGDVVLSMAGQKATTVAQLGEAMSKLLSGDKSAEPIGVTIRRSGLNDPVSLTIERTPQSTPGVPVRPRDPAPSIARASALGVAVREVNGHVVITRVFEQEPAAAAKLQPGDVIAGVGKTATDSFVALKAALANIKPGDEVPFDIVRGDKAAVVRIKAVTSQASTPDVVLDEVQRVVGTAKPLVADGDLAAEVRDLRARVETLETLVKELSRRLGSR